MKVRTNYRISPEHAKALNLPTKANKSRKSNSNTANSSRTGGGSVDKSCENDEDGTANTPVANDSPADGDGAKSGSPNSDAGSVTASKRGVVAAVGGNQDAAVSEFTSERGTHGSSGDGAAAAATAAPKVKRLSGWLERPESSRGARLGGSSAAARSRDAVAAVATPGTVVEQKKQKMVKLPPNTGSAARDEKKQKPAKLPVSTGKAKGRQPKAIGWESASGGGGGAANGSRYHTQSLVEDELLHAREEEEAQKAAVGVAAVKRRPPRPTPVHRLQVPPETVGDLLIVWDFLKVRDVVLQGEFANSRCIHRHMSYHGLHCPVTVWQDVACTAVLPTATFLSAPQHNGL